MNYLIIFLLFLMAFALTSPIEFILYFNFRFLRIYELLFRRTISYIIFNCLPIIWKLSYLINTSYFCFSISINSFFILTNRSFWTNGFRFLAFQLSATNTTCS